MKLQPVSWFAAPYNSSCSAHAKNLLQIQFPKLHSGLKLQLQLWKSPKIGLAWVCIYGLGRSDIFQNQFITIFLLQRFGTENISQPVDCVTKTEYSQKFVLLKINHTCPLCESHITLKNERITCTICNRSQHLSCAFPEYNTKELEKFIRLDGMCFNCGECRKNYPQPLSSTKTASKLDWNGEW